MNAPTPLLEARSISKRFGAVQAVIDVSMTLVPGEIHAVLGENGAGKSTLMGVLAGLVVPDEGQVTLDGLRLPMGRAFESKRRGIGMIHQHFTLVPEFSVAENLALAKLESLWKPLNITRLSADALAVAKELGWALDPEAKVGNLPVGLQQRVEILKALVGETSVLIFDEPTAALSHDEVRDLFRVLRKLKESGKAIVLIAHKLAEVMAISDRITVLRKGQVIATVLTTDTNETELAEWMVGHLPAGLNKSESETGDVLLSVDGMQVVGDRGEEAVRGATFCVRRGEIVGFGGVDGNGQIELAEALAGVRPFSGTLKINTEAPVVAYVPQDRQNDGLALSLSVKDNLLVRHLNEGLLKRRELARWASSVVHRYDVRLDSIEEPVGSLSGGNQQKIIVARVLESKPDLLVAVNPTSGLDIRATEFVHNSILSARDAGAAVALFSNDLDELAALANRTVFMSSGQLYASSNANAFVGGG